MYCESFEEGRVFPTVMSVGPNKQVRGRKHGLLLGL